NPNIYVSCIKQLWTTVVVKKENDVIRLQALVDKKKVVVTEATIREALSLDDAEGVECLPNEEIFVELAIMGYERPSTKLTFYKAFFSSQWKFLIHIILQCMSAKRNSWNEFSSLMASAVICPSSGDLSTHITKYTSPALTQKVFANMRRAGKAFSRVETPLFEDMLVEQQVVEEEDADENDEHINAGDTAEGDVSAAHGEVSTVVEEPSILLLKYNQHHHNHLRRVEHLEFDKVAQAIKITKLKQRVKKLERRNKERMIADMDDDDVVLEEAKEVVDAAKDGHSADIQGRTAKSQAEIYKIDLDHANKVLSIVTATPSRRRKGVVIRDLQEESTISTIIPAKTKSKDKHKGILAKEDPAVKRYQVLKRKPQTKAQARKNIMVYLKNVAGFKMDYFKIMSYDDIRPIFEAKFNTNVAFLQKTKEQIEEEESRALKRLNETPAEKAAKKAKVG
nr:hypothetical protein [Tanacetum cinerariifolium]